jgi:hypothetical protein
MHPLVHLHVKLFLAMSILWSWHACFCSNAFASLRTLQCDVSRMGNPLVLLLSLAPGMMLQVGLGFLPGLG